jgi:hypothetical protein
MNPGYKLSLLRKITGAAWLILAIVNRKSSIHS